MPNPKSGKAGVLALPVAPRIAKEAVDSNSGQAETATAVPQATASPSADSAKHTKPPATPAKPKTPTCQGVAIVSRTYATMPPDRTRSVVGVGEDVELSSSGKCAIIEWAISGGGLLSASYGFLVLFTAGDRAANAIITGKCSHGTSAVKKFRVLEPAAVSMVLAKGKGVYHEHGIPSIGMMLDIYILPASVSFEYIEIMEGDCVSIASGYLKPLNGLHHAGHGAGTWVPVDAPPSAGKGSQVHGQDTAQSGPCDFGTVYSVGLFRWPIPWNFRVDQSGPVKQFTTITQIFTSDGAGGMTVSKGGSTAARALDDPTSHY